MIDYDVTSAAKRLHAVLLPTWRELLQSPDISIDDDFFEAGGDSLLATELILQLGRVLGHGVPETLLFETSTIRTLSDRLCAAQELHHQIVVEVSAGTSDEPPLIFFHGDWTAGGFYLKHLASRLGPDLSLIAVAPHGMHDEPVPDSIETMAANRLSEILKACPSGPYRLGGHCVGAIVALETARLLIAARKTVEIVVMVDPPLIVGGKLLAMPSDTAQQYEPIGADEVTAAPQGILAIPDLTPASEPWQQYGVALEAYSPAPLPVPLMLFMSEHDGRPWCELSAQSELIAVPGGHVEWITSRAYAFAVRVKAKFASIRIAQLTTELDEVLRQRDAAQQQWKETLDSTSWKISRWLRWIGACLPPGIRRYIRRFV